MLEPELYVMGASGGVYALLISQLANILLVSDEGYSMRRLFLVCHCTASGTNTNPVSFEEYRPLCCLACSPTLKMESVYFSKRSVNFHRTIRCHFPEDHRRQNLKSHIPECHYRVTFLKCLGICLFRELLPFLVSKVTFICAVTLTFDV
jgi:hypothetical protein